MAGVVEQRIHDNGMMVAGADLSEKQFRCVKITGDYQIGVCDSAGEQSLGILQNIPVSGNTANVRDLGLSRVVVGTGGLSAGDKWTTDANGAAVAATAGDVAMGVCFFGAAATELAGVYVGFGANQILA